jgi:hypothetical protein
MFEWNKTMYGKLRNTNNIVNTYDEVSALSSLSFSLKNIYMYVYMYVCVYVCVCIYLQAYFMNMNMNHFDINTNITLHFNYCALYCNLRVAMTGFMPKKNASKVILICFTNELNVIYLTNQVHPCMADNTVSVLKSECRECFDQMSDIVFMEYCYWLLLLAQHCYSLLLLAQHCYSLLLLAQHCYSLLLLAQHCHSLLLLVQHCYLLQASLTFLQLLNDRSLEWAQFRKKI